MRLAALRLPDLLIKELEVVAEQLQRPKSFIIRRALETYLHEHADYQIALDRLNDKDDEIISSAEMRHSINGKKHSL